MTHFNAAFWRWFGDSKVVDADGQPLVVYHGTRENEFGVFDLEHSGRGRGSLGEKAFFFSTDPETAEASAYVVGSGGGIVYPVYLSIQNPFVSDMIGYNSKAVGDTIKKSKKLGHDGIFFPLMDYHGESGTIAVFRPEQIKSATANRGTWSRTDPDIRKNPDPLNHYWILPSGKTVSVKDHDKHLRDLLHKMGHRIPHNKHINRFEALGKIYGSGTIRIAQWAGGGPIGQIVADLDPQENMPRNLVDFLLDMKIPPPSILIVMSGTHDVFSGTVGQFLEEMA